ncbi:hypothetical protein AUEXF2481DRAFT_696682 [Aureobasidium subglaciale EXF-2481]|uniref:Uncharacterized protein n=1 Tax=Aureobasidium subglaciale (strain EXF-2481) TaxID=1043005 RepID=A0A074YUQ9_AURSE|nr:uncharacterized protein AUEXF2481DRAFT_696682 [Aureobasidium subglaciale EXF-2481]KEQ99904.1 hypothetical protein AUEXF2481DRAFT_696682 [Aureobasidium subglaciale EXF-2481]
MDGKFSAEDLFRIKKETEGQRQREREKRRIHSPKVTEKDNNAGDSEIEPDTDESSDSEDESDSDESSDLEGETDVEEDIPTKRVTHETILVNGKPVQKTNTLRHKATAGKNFQDERASCTESYTTTEHHNESDEDVSSHFNAAAKHAGTDYARTLDMHRILHEQALMSMPSNHIRDFMANTNKLMDGENHRNKSIQRSSSGAKKSHKKRTLGRGK